MTIRHGPTSYLLHRLALQWTTQQNIKLLRQLDGLVTTASGLDKLPVWYLQLDVPVFCQPICWLFNLLFAESTALSQWQVTWIQLVSKASSITEHSDFRSIFVTPVLARVMGRIIVQHLISCSCGSCTRTVFHRPICFSSNWLYYSSLQYLSLIKSPVYGLMSHMSFSQV